MKKYKRRRFLLFASQVGASALLGSLSKCSSQSPNSTNKKSEKEMNELKEEIIKLVRAGKVIKLKWDCGGDEAHVFVTIDGEEINYHDKIFEALDIHVINMLNLPDVGEFAMEGEGTIIEDNGEIYIEYESILKGFIDYGEKGEKYEWVESNKKEEAYSGKKELFKK